MLYSEYKKEKTINTVLGVVIILIGMIVFFFILRYALIKNDIKTCKKWQEYERLYPNFTVSPEMNEFCSHYNIEFKP